jgi:hypothetical protein
MYGQGWDYKVQGKYAFRGTIIPSTMYGQGWDYKVQARLSVECGQCLANRTVLHGRKAVKIWLLSLLFVCNLNE